MATIFIVHTMEDADCLKRLKKHLEVIKERSSETQIKDRNSVPVGMETEKVTQEYLEEAVVIVLLYSANFSDDGWCVRAMKTAIDRQAAGTVEVLVVIARESAWKLASFAGIKRIKILPTYTGKNTVAIDNVRAVIDRRWSSSDYPYVQIVNAVWNIVYIAMPKSE